MRQSETGDDATALLSRENQTATGKMIAESNGYGQNDCLSREGDEGAFSLVLEKALGRG